MSGETLKEMMEKLLNDGKPLDPADFKPSEHGTMVIGGCCAREELSEDIEINVDPPSPGDAKEISAKIWEEFEGSFKEAWEQHAEDGK